jgi:hypothetical protein
VVVDIRVYLLYLLLMMWGFACAYCVLFRRDQQHEQFSSVGHAMLTMFSYALGGVDLDIMLGGSNPQASLILSLLYRACGVGVTCCCGQRVSGLPGSAMHPPAFVTPCSSHVTSVAPQPPQSLPWARC